MIYSLLSYIVDMWLCSVSWGSYLVSAALFISLFAFVCILRMRIIKAVFLALSAAIIAKVTFHSLGFSCAYINPATYAYLPYHAASIIVGLAVSYSLIELLFFALIAKRFNLKPLPLALVMSISNCISAAIIYYLPTK